MTSATWNGTELSTSPSGSVPTLVPIAGGLGFNLSSTPMSSAPYHDLGFNVTGSSTRNVPTLVPSLDLGVNVTGLSISTRYVPPAPWNLTALCTWSNCADSSWSGGTFTYSSDCAPCAQACMEAAACGMVNYHANCGGYGSCNVLNAQQLSEDYNLTNVTHWSNQTYIPLSSPDVLAKTVDEGYVTDTVEDEATAEPVTTTEPLPTTNPCNGNWGSDDCPTPTPTPAPTPAPTFNFSIATNATEMYLANLARGADGNTPGPTPDWYRVADGLHTYSETLPGTGLNYSKAHYQAHMPMMPETTAMPTPAPTTRSPTPSPTPFPTPAPTPKREAWVWPVSTPWPTPAPTTELWPGWKADPHDELQQQLGALLFSKGGDLPPGALDSLWTTLQNHTASSGKKDPIADLIAQMKAFAKNNTAINWDWDDNLHNMTGGEFKYGRFGRKKGWAPGVMGNLFGKLINKYGQPEHHWSANYTGPPSIPHVPMPTYEAGNRTGCPPHHEGTMKEPEAGTDGSSRRRWRETFCP